MDSITARHEELLFRGVVGRLDLEGRLEEARLDELQFDEVGRLIADDREILALLSKEHLLDKSSLEVDLDIWMGKPEDL